MSLTSDKIDFTGERALQVGAIYDIPFVVKKNGVPIPLTGYIVQTQLKKYLDSTSFISVPTTIKDSSKGLIEISFNETVIVPKLGRYYYRSLFTNNSGTYCFLEGEVDFVW